MKAQHAGKMVKFVTQLTLTVAAASPFFFSRDSLVHCIFIMFQINAQG